jgi:hypothetical protein
MKMQRERDEDARWQKMQAPTKPRYTNRVPQCRHPGARHVPYSQWMIDRRNDDDDSADDDSDDGSADRDR